MALDGVESLILIFTRQPLSMHLDAFKRVGERLVVEGDPSVLFRVLPFIFVSLSFKLAPTSGEVLNTCVEAGALSNHFTDVVLLLKVARRFLIQLCTQPFIHGGYLRHLMGETLVTRVEIHHEPFRFEKVTRCRKGGIL